MSVGISLSQFISDKPDPIPTGIPTLDTLLNGGFHPRNIYEVYGPPGIGKTFLAKQVASSNTDSSTLWIETFKYTTLPTETHTPSKTHKLQINKVTITKLSFLIRYLQRLSESYKLIVIDGFSQLISDYINQLSRRGYQKDPLHDLKCKYLNILLTMLTKYCNRHNSTVLLMNDCLNTSYQEDMHAQLQQGMLIDSRNQFLVSNNWQSNISLRRRYNVQTLKSALVATEPGNQNNKWEVLITQRIGLFWQWKQLNPNKKNKPIKTRVAIVTHPGNHNTNHNQSHMIQNSNKRQKTVAASMAAFIIRNDKRLEGPIPVTPTVTPVVTLSTEEPVGEISPPPMPLPVPVPTLASPLKPADQQSSPAVVYDSEEN